ncbi:MAG: hypothetical protein P8P74_09825 [Crocinitomicaceae bacterium]|nr:hypothetical protein [Crocinitomicaceae bacterium]
MKFILTLFIILALASCKKVRLTGPKENDFLRGKYEWVYSYGYSDNESESFETVSDRYAMKFKSSGNILIYKNGELIKKGYVSSIGGVYNNKRTIGTANLAIGNGLMYTNNTLEIYSWPIEDQVNLFQKQ